MIFSCNTYYCIDSPQLNKIIIRSNRVQYCDNIPNHKWIRMEHSDRDIPIYSEFRAQYNKAFTYPIPIVHRPMILYYYYHLLTHLLWFLEIIYSVVRVSWLEKKLALDSIKMSVFARNLDATVIPIIIQLAWWHNYYLTTTSAVEKNLI